MPPVKKKRSKKKSDDLAATTLAVISDSVKNFLAPNRSGATLGDLLKKPKAVRPAVEQDKIPVDEKGPENPTKSDTGLVVEPPPPPPSSTGRRDLKRRKVPLFISKNSPKKYDAPPPVVDEPRPVVADEPEIEVPFDDDDNLLVDQAPLHQSSTERIATTSRKRPRVEGARIVDTRPPPAPPMHSRAESVEEEMEEIGDGDNERQRRVKETIADMDPAQATHLLLQHRVQKKSEYVMDTNEPLKKLYEKIAVEIEYRDCCNAFYGLPPVLGSTSSPLSAAANDDEIREDPVLTAKRRLERCVGVADYVHTLEDKVFKRACFDYCGDYFPVERFIVVQGAEGSGKRYATRAFCESRRIGFIGLDAHYRRSGLLSDVVQFARYAQPCVIFIDRIDVWMHRDSYQGYIDSVGELFYVLRKNTLAPSDQVWFVLSSVTDVHTFHDDYQGTVRSFDPSVCTATPLTHVEKKTLLQTFFAAKLALLGIGGSADDAQLTSVLFDDGDLDDIVRAQVDATPGTIWNLLSRTFSRILGQVQSADILRIFVFREMMNERGGGAADHDMTLEFLFELYAKILPKLRDFTHRGPALPPRNPSSPPRPKRRSVAGVRAFDGSVEQLISAVDAAQEQIFNAPNYDPYEHNAMLRGRHVQQNAAAAARAPPTIPASARQESARERRWRESQVIEDDRMVSGTGPTFVSAVRPSECDSLFGSTHEKTLDFRDGGYGGGNEFVVDEYDDGGGGGNDEYGDNEYE